MHDLKMFPTVILRYSSNPALYQIPHAQRQQSVWKINHTTLTSLPEVEYLILHYFYQCYSTDFNIVILVLYDGMENQAQGVNLKG